MPNSTFNLTDQRKNTPANKELRRLVLCGNLMQQMISNETAPQLHQDLAKNWETQLERARIAGALK